MEALKELERIKSRLNLFDNVDETIFERNEKGGVSGIRFEG